MKKIMFNEHFGLQQSVLDGTKDMTRRICTMTLHRKMKDGTMEEIEPDDMADVCIRLFDLLGVLNKEERIEFDLLQVIVTNQKKVVGYDYMSFTERAFALCNILTSRSSVERVICRALAFVVKWAQDMKIDLDYHIEMKMRYNELRENKHGKKY